MTTQRQALEDAAIVALQPLRKVGDGGGAAGYLRAVKPYGGEIDTRNMELLRATLVGQAPGILLATGAGTTRPRLSRRRGVKDLTLELLIVSMSQRSAEARLRGDTSEGAGADPGIYQILDDVAALLTGFDPGVDGVGLLSPHTEKPLLVEPGLTIWFQSFLVPTDVARPAAVEGDISSIVSAVDFPAAEETFASGTGDAFTVAAGVVTLTDAAALFDTAWTPANFDITIAGATNAANDGTFPVTRVPGNTSIQFTNAAGVAGAFAGTWKVHPRAKVLVSTT